MTTWTLLAIQSVYMIIGWLYGEEKQTVTVVLCSLGFTSQLLSIHFKTLCNREDSTSQANAFHGSMGEVNSQMDVINSSHPSSSWGDRVGRG